MGGKRDLKKDEGGKNAELEELARRRFKTLRSLESFIEDLCNTQQKAFKLGKTSTNEEGKTISISGDHTRSYYCVCCVDGIGFVNPSICSFVFKANRKRSGDSRREDYDNFNQYWAIDEHGSNLNHSHDCFATQNSREVKALASLASDTAHGSRHSGVTTLCTSDTQMYQQPIPSIYSGRASLLNFSSEYWHEQIKCVNIYELSSSSQTQHFGFLGYCIEEGVRRNKGRVGTAGAPDEIRKQMGKFAAHHDSSRFPLIDYGNVRIYSSSGGSSIAMSGDEIPEEGLEAAQDCYSNFIANIISSGGISVGLGGGHDMAYAHFNGLRKALEFESPRGLEGEKYCVGILNFDAHFDLRPSEQDKSTSGTPFYQILVDTAGFNSSHSVKYFVIGIQGQANPLSLYDIADKFGVRYIPVEDCIISEINSIVESVKEYFSNCKALYITVDLDGFSSAYAPGVSAPGPFGFSVEFFRNTLTQIVSVMFDEGVPIRSFDVAETNTTYDIDGRTSRLAAQIIHSLVSSIGRKR